MTGVIHRAHIPVVRLRQREPEPHRARPDAPRGGHRAPAHRDRHRVTRRRRGPPRTGRDLFPPGRDNKIPDIDVFTTSKYRIVNMARL